MLRRRTEFLGYVLDRLRPKQITLRKLIKVPIGERDDPNSEHAA